jgi:hypothetical protein
VAEAI